MSDVRRPGSGPGCPVVLGSSLGAFVDHPLATDVVAIVEERAHAWRSVVCSYLDLAVPELTIILESATTVAMTRGTHIHLPLVTTATAAADAVAPALAGLPHELVHAVAGRSPNQALNEGLAVHVDARLNLAGPVWPFYHLPPRRWTRVFIDDGSHVNVAALDAPDQRWAPDDSRPDTLRRRATLYLEAASFTGFVLAERGREGFWPAFRAGDLAGSDPAGWEVAWTGNVGGPLTSDEIRRRDASLTEGSHRPRRGRAEPAPGAARG